MVCNWPISFAMPTTRSLSSDDSLPSRAALRLTVAAERLSAPNAAP
jgi:hypothetical protein